jgi:hypothetical protein
MMVISVHLETAHMGVILRSKATKNLIVAGSAEILRFAQNDMRGFRMDGNYCAASSFIHLRTISTYRSAGVAGI